MKGFLSILVLALFLGAAVSHHVSEYENLPGWGRIYTVVDPTANTAALAGLRNLFSASGNLGLVDLIATQTDTQLGLFMVFTDPTSLANNQAAINQYLESATFTNAYNATDLVFTGTIGEHEDEDDVAKAVGQYNVMTLYTVKNTNDLNNVVENRFEDVIDDEAGFVEFIGMPYNNNANYFTSVIFTSQAAYDAAVAKVSADFFTDVIEPSASLRANVLDTYQFSHHDGTTTATSDAAKIAGLSFVASIVYLLL